MGPDFINKAKPFLHAAIVSILQDVFLSANRGACLINKHADCFKSSVPQCSKGLEVTAPMAAFAATCCYDTTGSSDDKSLGRRLSDPRG